MKLDVEDRAFLDLFEKYGDMSGKEIKLKTKGQLEDVLGITQTRLSQLESDPEAEEYCDKLSQIEDVRVFQSSTVPNSVIRFSHGFRFLESIESCSSSL